MADMSAQDLAAALIKANASTIRNSYLMDDQHDGYNNGVAGAVEDAVIMAFGFSRDDARTYIRIVCGEV